jgi:hypothetical protein
MIYTKQNIIRGAVVYAIGDSIASTLMGQFSIIRLLGVALLGATLYAFETPNIFAWIDRVSKPESPFYALKKTGLAVLYFNPLWIARHLFILRLLSGLPVSGGIFDIALESFTANIPVAFIANYVIQNRVPADKRFLASAIFSGLMAIYYALSEVIFFQEVA